MADLIRISERLAGTGTYILKDSDLISIKSIIKVGFATPSIILKWIHNTGNTVALA